MSTISQRELRNDNAEIVRRIEQGEAFTVTRRGVPVARLSPVAEDDDLRCLRPPKRRPTYSEMPRVNIEGTTADLLDDLRGDR